MTKHEYERELKAMQEKRARDADVFNAGWEATGREKLATYDYMLARFLDERWPLPVWVEPQPTVTGPTGRRYWMETARGSAGPAFYLRSGTLLEYRIPVDHRDKSAAALALLGPEGTADFCVQMHAETFNTGIPRNSYRQALLDAWPRLVALAAKGETP